MQELRWEGETGSRSQSCTLEQMFKRRMTTGPHGLGIGVVGGVGGCWTGQGRGIVRGTPSHGSTPVIRREAGRQGLGVGCAHFQCLLHVTPASSACPQFVTPHLEKVQRKMVSSVPLQATSSIQILPVPVETSQHGFLADVQESRTEEKGGHCCVCP